ncbi:Regulatory sensor-transducer, BlaR1/MecR1 family / TonB-dependent receptor [hydrothermal vent metagenome]|uniref:Regulatory sensor-transducer, BlaR1/MecR1 family / TonB-dependent receptor n=1 Tax=hydrothermal vent metagenome TaxID=652676 RepID=A0A3B0TYD9_9ZZZZ
MVQYILECIAFQLVFLIIYDLFLKRETFFQWNRVYLISTYALSLFLPWVKIEALKISVPNAFKGYSEFLWSANDAAVTVTGAEDSIFQMPWEYVVLFGGMFIATFFFVYKLLQIQQLKQKGQVHYFKDFTQVIVANSSLAFSFFKSVFLGDKIVEEDYKNIVAHELVHIRQKHSYDLLFFELMRIVGWFNPLVYVYQNRISELHEFIADAQVAKTNKRAQYQLLLSQVFQTQKISFINQFFNHSLIKKRIVMLQKTESSRIWKLKYLTLVPVLAAMLFYSSCQEDVETPHAVTIIVGDIENLTQDEESEMFTKLIPLSERYGDWILYVKDDKSTIEFTKSEEGSGISGPDNTLINAKMNIISNVLDDNLSLFVSDKTRTNNVSLEGDDVPFAVVDEVPVFPGCENDSDPKSCFNKMIQRHISKNFKYPEEAQVKGIQGRVAVIFIISEDGTIQNIKSKGPDTLLENEVERIIKRLPKMTPGKHNGVTVNVPYSIPIMFKLQ